MTDIYTWAANLIRSNPKVANTPQGQQALRLIESHDDQAGAQMANNFCNSYGISPEQMLRNFASNHK